MDNSSATEAPIEEYLADLRSRGIVARSAGSSFAVGTIALVISLLILESSLRRIVGEWLALVSAGRVEISEFSDLPLDTMKVILLPCLLFSFGYWITSLLQTRFLFRWDALSFNISKIWRPNSRVSSTFDFLLRIIAQSIFCSLLAGIIVGLVAYVSWTDLLALLNSESNKLIGSMGAIAMRLLGIFLVLLIMGAVISWLYVVLMFKYRYRMSRAQVAQYADRRD